MRKVLSCLIVGLLVPSLVVDPAIAGSLVFPETGNEVFIQQALSPVGAAAGTNDRLGSIQKWIRKLEGMEIRKILASPDRSSLPVTLATVIRGSLILGMLVIDRRFVPAMAVVMVLLMIELMNRWQPPFVRVLPDGWLNAGVVPEGSLVKDVSDLAAGLSRIFAKHKKPGSGSAIEGPEINPFETAPSQILDRLLQMPDLKEAYHTPQLQEIALEMHVRLLPLARAVEIRRLKKVYGREVAAALERARFVMPAMDSQARIRRLAQQLYDGIPERPADALGEESISQKDPILALALRELIETLIDTPPLLEIVARQSHQAAISFRSLLFKMRDAQGDDLQYRDLFVRLVSKVILYGDTVRKDDVPQAALSPADQWENTFVAALPLREEDLCRVCAGIALAKTWNELKHDGWVNLKSLVQEAFRRQAQEDLGVDVISPTLLRKLLARPDGVWELLRRVHPYTIRSLAERDRYSSFFVTHEGQYYSLFAEQLLGRLPAGGRAVLLFDPHTDSSAKKTYSEKETLDAETRIVTVRGRSDATWASAALADGLASCVVQIDIFPAPHYTILTRDPNGTLRLSVPRALINFDASVLGREPAISVDLDLLSNRQRGISATQEGLHILSRFIAGIVSKFNVRPNKLTIAQSPDYIDLSVTTPAYISEAASALQTVFEEAYAPGPPASDFGLSLWLSNPAGTGEPSKEIFELLTSVYDWRSAKGLWGDLVNGLLKWSVDSAHLTRQDVEFLIRRDRGFWGLVRRVHPYTREVLTDPAKWVHSFTDHVGVYYTLYARRLEGRLPPRGAIVLTFDPLVAELMTSTPYGSTSIDDLASQKRPVGVNSRNWAEAAVVDYLAEAVLTVGFGGHMTILSMQDGVLKKWQQTELKLEWLQRAAGRLWASIDLRNFSLTAARTNAPFHHITEKRERTVANLVESLQAVVRVAESPLEELILSESADWLDPRADASYRKDLMDELQIRIGRRAS